MVALAAGAGCNPPSPTVAYQDSVSLTDSPAPGAPHPFRHEESWAVVIPAHVNAHCPQGRVVVGHGGGISQLTLLPLDAAETQTSWTQVVPGVNTGRPAPLPGGVLPAGSWATWTPAGCIASTSDQREYDWSGVDPAIVRTTPANLLHASAARKYYVEIDGFGCPLLKSKPVLVARRSEDCGDSWTDFAVFEAPTADPAWGCCDRQELCVDPWSTQPMRTAWMTAREDWRSPVDGTQQVSIRLWRSYDEGRTWQQVASFDPRGYGPNVMTSTRSGRLVMFSCRDGIPILRSVRDSGAATLDVSEHFLSWLPACDIVGNPSYDSATRQNSTWLPAYVLNRINQPSISRTDALDPWGRPYVGHGVRLAYPSVEWLKDPAAPGFWIPRQVVTVAAAALDERAMPGGPPTIVATAVEIGTVRSVQTRGSLLHPHFIETDRHELALDRHDDAVLLTWIDAEPGAGGRISTFGAMLQGAFPRLGQRFPLSRRAGAGFWWLPNPECGRQPVNAPLDPEKFDCFIGDFTYGAFYYSDPSKPGGDGTLRFFAQWSESDVAPLVPIEPASFPAHPTKVVFNPAANNSLHYNIVRVGP
jgi:hypothetical protein